MDKNKRSRFISLATLLEALGWFCVCTCLVAASLQVSVAAPSAEVFGALPVETDAVLSPDGRWLAWLDQKEAKPRVVIVDLNTRKIQRVGALPEHTTLRNLRWCDTETLLVTVGKMGEAGVPARLAGGYSLTVAMSPTRDGVVMLPAVHGRPADPDYAMRAHMVRTRTTKPHTVIMSIGPSLLEVDTTIGRPEQIKDGNEYTVSWAVDRAGKPVAREDWDWKKRAYRVYALKGNSIKEILRQNDSSAPRLAGLLPDDSALVLLASNGKAHVAAWALPLDGSPQRLIAEDPDADITSTYTDSNTGAIVGVHVSGTRTDVQWIDPTAQHREEVLQRSFPNRQLSIYGWTSSGTKTLVQVQSPTSPPICYLVDFTSHRADIATEEYPGLSGVKLGELKEITYKARDGTEIPAYLTLPADGPPGMGPLVVLPHPGPNERDYPVFNWIAQFLASRGYAVLQPQYRGSSGFGEAFQKAGYRQWGALMQDDVTDGVKAMIEQNVADPRRVCILGFAYGGYAALAGAAFTPDLYACAISVNGISNLRALLEVKVPQSDALLHVDSAAMSAWEERIGSPSDSALDKKSPIHSIRSISAPIMLVYGTSDSVVPNAQSTEMAKALSAAGKRVTVVNLAGEDHWFSHTDTRVQMLKAFESFLHDNL